MHLKWTGFIVLAHFLIDIDLNIRSNSNSEIFQCTFYQPNRIVAVRLNSLSAFRLCSLTSSIATYSGEESEVVVYQHKGYLMISLQFINLFTKNIRPKVYTNMLHNFQIRLMNIMIIFSVDINNSSTQLYAHIFNFLMQLEF